ncbi:MAG: peptidoglycan-binding protein [Bifidobacteriaceae bacterium]|jgi:hypothetical protein|nr:peptidoglycan-binding protein [Bifidobacteriaceae bacterium]
MAAKSLVRSWLAWIGAAVWCLAPAGAYWLLSERSQAVSFDEPVAVDGEVRSNDGGSIRDVELVLTWRSPTALVAPDWTGLVQEVVAEPGGLLSSGDVVARVAGVDRMACASAYPMEGTVASKDKGQDVEVLQQCLTLFGYDLSADKGAYGKATERAVEEWSRKTGALSQNGTVFEAAWLVYLPEESYPLASVDLKVAAPAPPAGTPMATAKPSLSRAVVASADGPHKSGALDEDGEAEGPAREVAPEELVTAEEDESLLIGSVTLGLTEDRTEVAPDSLAVLSAEVAANAASVSASLRRTGGVGEFLVPAAAVVATSGGTTCVLRVDGNALEPVAVKVVGEVSGNSIITGALSPGERVRIAPAAGDRRC